MRRSLVSFVIGLVLAFVAVLIMNRVVSNRPDVVQVQRAQPEVELTKVVVAKAELPFGTTLRRDHFKEIVWPADNRIENGFSSVDELFEGADGDRIVLKSISKDEPILKTKISGFGEKASLSRKVNPDMRAYSVRINDVSGVAGFLLPGDRVDVMLTRKLGRDRDNLVTDVILQNIIILGIDQLSDEEREKPALARTATFEVSTEQAQKLALAQQVGSLSLALRNYASGDEIKTDRVSTSDLAALKRRAVQRPVVKVRKGTEETVYKSVPN